jgi:hypothetical protein
VAWLVLKGFNVLAIVSGAPEPTNAPIEPAFSDRRGHAGSGTRRLAGYRSHAIGAAMPVDNEIYNRSTPRDSTPSRRA